MLQWGHALSGMDMISGYVGNKYGTRLQWGHALSGMDMAKVEGSCLFFALVYSYF